jgi:hypothetical protein
MTLTAAEVKALRRVFARRSRAELKQVFALVRAHPDRTLMAAALPAKPKASPRRGDPLVRELQQTLKPLLGPAQEKADLLVEHLAKKYKHKLAIHPRGLADATRQLRTRFSDAQISAGAKSLVSRLSKLYGGGDSVV